jgi:hypothetical protein
MSADKQEPPIMVKLGASAEAQLNVSAQIPEASTGRLVDALTDMIRPFTEARGLKADKIRLQREEVLIEIARRARRKLELDSNDPATIPNKLLVPILERASNEELSDEFMLDQWSNLLASATIPGKVEPRYVAILSELSGKQARLLERICRNGSEYLANWRALLEDACIFLESHAIRAALVGYFRERKTIPDVDEIYETVYEQLNYPGMAIVDIIVHYEEDSWSMHYVDASWSLSMSEAHPYGKNEYALDLEILTSLGMLRRANLFVYSRFKHEIQLIYYHVTELGVAMFNSCNNKE